MTDYKLVEALDITELRKLLLILRGNIGGAMWTLDDEEEELAARTEKAIDALDALAAHRKQQGRGMSRSGYSEDVYEN